MPPQEENKANPSTSIPPVLSEHLKPHNLEKYSFYWSEARLAVAALALFLGGVPPVVKFFPFLFPASYQFLTLFWVISGVVSAYLLWQWVKGGKKIFGGNDMKDTVAFFVNIVSGFNLGITGLIGTNIGMSLTPGTLKYPLFILVGLIYLASAWHLHKRWTAFGKKLF